jgi:hypothetical protein
MTDTYTLNSKHIGYSIAEAAAYVIANPLEFARHPVLWDCGDCDPDLTWIDVDNDIRDEIALIEEAA